MNFNSDSFVQKEDPASNFNYNHYTFGLFTLDNWEITGNLIWQPGMRIDYQNKYKFFLLPQSFFLYKFNKNFNLRFGGGMGYKIPTIFTNKAEERIFKKTLHQFQQI